MTTVAEVIVQSLVDHKITTVYGLPGGENVPIMAALKQAGIEFILVHNESTAVYMAAVDARLTGKIGVALTTLGPGALNAAAGLGHAHLDRSPILLITACVDDEVRPYHTHQILNQNDIFAPLCKASITLNKNEVYQQMAHATALPWDQWPGPVHIQVSKNEAQQEAVPSEIQPTQAPQPLPNDWGNAQTSLNKSARPLVIVGLGLEAQRPYHELRVLAEALNAPIILTPKAKGAIPADHPLYAGTIGLTRTDPVYEILAEADTILAIGFDVVELVKPWDETAPVLWLAPWQNKDVPIDAVASHSGEMAPILTELSHTTYETDPEWGANRIKKFQADQAAIPLAKPAPGRLRPQAVLQAVRASVPRNTLVSTDVGAHKILTSLAWPAYAPNSFMLSNGLSCMGYGLPAAIAASRILGKPTVSVTGDGGMAMVIGELGLLKRLNLPVIIVIMNDSALDLIRSAQNRMGQETFGTEFVNPDWLHIAKAYDIPAVRVTTAEAITTAVEQAIQNNHYLIIDAQIDPVSYPTTPRE